MPLSPIQCGIVFGHDKPVKRFMAIIVISAFVIWVGAGCKSLPGKLEIDTPFFDIEYDGSVG